MTYIKKTDELGRVYIPADVREACGFEPGVPIEIILDGETVALRRYSSEEEPA